MYKLVVLAVLVAAASASVIHGGVGLPIAGGLAYGGNLGGLGYAGNLGGYGLGYGQPIVSAGYGHAIAAQPIIHQAPRTYAAPPIREHALAPIVERYVEPVEKHGYKIRY